MRAAPRVQLLLVAAGASVVASSLGWAGADWPPGSPEGLLQWYEGVGPARVAVALLRAGAIAGCVWLLVAASLQLGAGLRPLRGLGTLADRVSPAVIRRLAGTAVAASMSVAAAGPAVAGDGVGQPGTAVMVVVDDRPAAPPADPVPAPVTPAPPAALAAPAPRSAEVRVVAGDSFWRLAEMAVERAQEVAPSDAEVASYWRRVIEANRDRLVDPGNADLLLPGQVVVLPEV